MDSIEASRDRDPDRFAGVLRLVREAGTDNLSHFGNGYVLEGGLSLQQHPEEFAALALLLGNHARGAYLEIGSASGGVARFLDALVGYEKMLSIDDGLHHRYPELTKNFAVIGPRMEHLRADSHGDVAEAWLTERLGGTKLDVAFIDGDHTFEGAWCDVELVRPHLRPGAVVILHDTVAVDDVRRVWQLGAEEKIWHPFAEYIGGGYRPLGIGVGIVP